MYLLKHIAKNAGNITTQFLMFQSNRFAAKPIRLNRKPVRLKQNRYFALWDPNISFIVVVDVFEPTQTLLQHTEAK